jgi:uncharacterized membrane protein YhaH (DUF805 family)
MIAPLCMGYKDYGKSDGFDRAVWLLLICLVEGLGGVTRAWLNLIIAPISGLIIGLIIFLVR